MIASRTIVVDGITWAVTPSGFVTQNLADEFGLVFTRVDTGTVRFTRYAPAGIRGREAAFERLTDAALARLLATSQASVRAPEGGYRQ